MTILQPFNLNSWIEENRDLLKPPVSNKNLYLQSGDYIVMIVGGPYARNDYHYNETEELFFQLEGHIQVAIREDSKKKVMKLGPGDMFLLPARIPHSPRRSEGSIGLVVERVRKGSGLNDGLLWFCDNCNHKLHEVYFELLDVEKDFQPHLKEFYSAEDLRACDNCGTVMEADLRYIEG